ncbi:MAG TPA: hypothetical protein VN516_05625, partial [Candidatus Baltobacteraceae bacterium]|nr:hypothetical protein [Candidatus Baltobacteraceae bacterium]
MTVSNGFPQFPASIGDKKTSIGHPTTLFPFQTALPPRFAHVKRSGTMSFPFSAHVICLFAHVFPLSAHVKCFSSHVKCSSSHVKWKTTHVKYEAEMVIFGKNTRKWQVLAFQDGKCVKITRFETLWTAATRRRFESADMSAHSKNTRLAKRGRK